MPFKSAAQMRLCYSLLAKGKNGSWDCDEWLRKTKSLDGKKLSARKRRRSAIKTGPRGGKYFEVGGTKIYVSRKSKKGKKK